LGLQHLAVVQQILRQDGFFFAGHYAHPYGLIDLCRQVLVTSPVQEIANGRETDRLPNHFFGHSAKGPLRCSVVVGFD
jgi:hypothetical protein